MGNLRRPCCHGGCRRQPHGRGDGQRPRLCPGREPAGGLRRDGDPPGGGPRRGLLLLRRHLFGRPEPEKECIGVVFQVGQHANDRSDYSQTGIGEAACHGYVVALQDASEELCLWGVYGYEIGLYPVDDSGNKIDNFTNNGGDTDWSGYLYTEKITLEAERNGGFTPTRRRATPSATTPGSSHRRFRPRPTRAAGSFPPLASSARSTGCASSSMPGRG